VGETPTLLGVDEDQMSRKRKHPREVSEPEVQITSEPQPSLPKDAASIENGDLEFRSVGYLQGREAKFQAVFTQEVIDEIHAHGKSSMEAEICGVLVGKLCRDSQGPYIHIHASIRGDASESRNAQVTFKAETWTHIQQVMERDHADAKIVGWYHTHPGFGIFLSGMDLFIQDNFFNLPWQVAMVYDPQAEEDGVFVWRNEKSEREAHLIEPRTEPIRPDNSQPEEIGAPPEAVPDTINSRTWLYACILFVASFGLTYAAISFVRSMH
jgi:proteasome lid subunit RPN8/RPN11